MSRKILPVLLMLLLLALCGCQAYSYDESYLSHNDYHSEDESEGLTDINEIFYDFATVDLDGNEVTQDFFTENELTLVNVWTTWCGPCKKELPALASAAEQYAERGFAVLGVLQDGVGGRELDVDTKATENAVKLLDNAGAKYTVIIPDMNWMTGILSVITAFPTSFFVDNEGKILERSFVIGSLDEEGWEIIIEEMLERVENE